MHKDQQEVPRLDCYGDFTDPRNDGGLPMKVTYDGKAAHSYFRIPSNMAGWKEAKGAIAHPGAISTALTTVMGQCAAFKHSRAASLKSFALESFENVPVESDLTCDSRVIALRRGNEAVVEGRIKDAGGNILAKSLATYELFTTDQLRDLKLCVSENIDAFEKMFAPV